LAASVEDDAPASALLGLLAAASPVLVDPALSVDAAALAAFVLAVLADDRSFLAQPEPLK
jgi:hypothetical protein